MELFEFADTEHKYRHPRNFYHLLRACHLLKSSDPRDKVYALLGVAPDRDEIGIAPRYDLPVEDIYCDVALRLVRTHQNLDIFSSMYPEKTFRLPSWVPNWSRAPDLPQDPLLDNPILLEHGLPRASGDTVAEFAIADNGAELVVRGGIIDRVAIVQDTESAGRASQKSMRDFLLQHLDHLATLPLYASPSSSAATVLEGIREACEVGGLLERMSNTDVAEGLYTMQRFVALVREFISS